MLGGEALHMGVGEEWLNVALRQALKQGCAVIRIFIGFLESLPPEHILYKERYRLIRHFISRLDFNQRPIFPRVRIIPDAHFIR